MPQSDLPIAELRAYTPALDVPADLDEFWSTTLADARRHDLAVSSTPVDTGSRSWRVRVGFPGTAERRTGWLHLPAGPRDRCRRSWSIIGYGGGRVCRTNGSCRRPRATRTS